MYDLKRNNSKTQTSFLNVFRCVLVEDDETDPKTENEIEEDQKGEGSQSTDKPTNASVKHRPRPTYMPRGVKAKKRRPFGFIRKFFRRITKCKVFKY